MLEPNRLYILNILYVDSSSSLCKLNLQLQPSVHFAAGLQSVW